MNRESMRMDQAFDLMHEAVRRIAAEVAAPQAADVDAKARFPSETVAALRDAGLLSAGVPRELGGAGCNLQQQAHLCATLAQACGSSAMVLAMHYIQLACIARHALESEFFRIRWTFAIIVGFVEPRILRAGVATVRFPIAMS